MKKLVPFLFTIFLCIGTAYAVDYPFSLTTSEIAANGTFQFKISASGTFYVDCGTGGTLSGTGVSGGTITKNDTDEYSYTCTYSSAGTKTIRFGGRATGYNTEYTSYYRSVAAIKFITTSLISAISGSIGQVFPTLGNDQNQQPTFNETFRASPITSIPENLFNGVTGGTNAMFFYTFSSCLRLTSIPANLFAGITGGYYKLFYGTFAGCVSLTDIPENLFADVVSSAGDEFMSTFASCTSLQNIPEKLFANIKIFNDCHYMFYGTFSGCSSLLSLPEYLFSNIPSTAYNKNTMFMYAFKGCTNLSGYVPPSMFSGFVTGGSPYETDMMTSIFYGTNLDTSCPAGITQYRTGYEQYWETGNGTAVSCGENTLNVNWWNGNTQLSVGSESQSCVYGDTITVPTINATKNGYHFNGWKIKQ